MALVYRKPFRYNTVQLTRFAIMVLFLISTILMVSFHISSWKYKPHLRDIKSEAENCDSTLQIRRSYEEKGKNIPTKSEGSGSGTRKIPALAELKSFRDTLDKVITIVEKQDRVTKLQSPEPHPTLSLEEVEAKIPDLRPQSISQSEREFLLRASNTNSPKYYNGTFVRKFIPDRRIVFKMDAVNMNITKLKPPDEIPVHPLSKEEPYKSRMNDIQEACKKYRDDKYNDLIDLKRLLYDDTHKTIMCVVPKAACTTWKSLMFYLMGKSTLENAFNVKKSYLVMNYGKMKSMARLSRQGVIERLNTYTKFMVTRHPYRRIVSAYKNKFQGPRTSFMYTHGRVIARKNVASYMDGYSVKYGRNSKQEVLETLTSAPEFLKLNPADQKKVTDITLRGFYGNITFDEFLRYGIIGNAATPHNLDVHWRPQHMLCNPCAVKYDFLVRFDNLEQDSVRVLDYIQKEDPKEKRIQFPTGNPAVNPNVTKNYFSNTSPEIFDMLREIYEKDFQYFNYDFENF